MEIFVDFVDTKYYGKTVDIVAPYLWNISGQEALNILFNQESDSYHKDNYKIVLYNRDDMSFKIKTCTSGMSVNTFADSKFNWYCIDKEYLLEELSK